MSRPPGDRSTCRERTDSVDTADLRSGPPLHDALLAMLPLVGVWRGTGSGVVGSDGSEFAFRQEARFVHDGRPFLAYESRAWLVGDDGGVLRPAWRESGFWRPGPEPDDVEALLVSHTGQALVFVGLAGDLRWELRTVRAQPTPSVRRIGGERRLYALMTGADGEQLGYATEVAADAGEPDRYAPHLNARLRRSDAAATDPGGADPARVDAGA